MTLRTVLVANRGEIAVRIVQACRKLGLRSVLAVSDADRDSLAARMADRVVCIGPARPTDSYLNHRAVIATALGTGADAIHPGYGFLSENAAFRAACDEFGVTFVGPSAEAIRTMGDKLAARAAVERLGVPLVPGSGQIRTVEDARAAVRRTGYPVLVKAAAGGGGRGIRVVREDAELEHALSSAAAEAQTAFGDPTLFLERYIATARHIEVQVFGDSHGNVINLGERDCSLQRRYQKVIEETPAPNLADGVREALLEAATLLTTDIGYQNAGTVEFVYDVERGEFHFLEMNTRIQVEHPVTEEVTGLDLVALQLQVAGGEPLPLSQAEVRPHGHAIECRITAESAEHSFRPSPGRITGWQVPSGEGIRLDTHCFLGYVVPPYYDSLLGKLITHGADRADAITKMHRALSELRVSGIETTAAYLERIVASRDFRAGMVSTTWIECHPELAGD